MCFNLAFAQLIRWDDLPTSDRCGHSIRRPILYLFTLTLSPMTHHSAVISGRKSTQITKTKGLNHRCNFLFWRGHIFQKYTFEKSTCVTYMLHACNFLSLQRCFDNCKLRKLYWENGLRNVTWQLTEILLSKTEAVHTAVIAALRDDCNQTERRAVISDSWGCSYLALRLIDVITDDDNECQLNNSRQSIKCCIIY